MTKVIFFAYESGHSDNIDAIKKAAKEYNTHQKTYYAKTWEELQVSGKIINKTILSEIDNCEIFACDLTYINYNVLFELGYAIGKKRKLLIFLNKTIENAASDYGNIRILKNVGYEPFINYKQIHGALQRQDKIETVILDQMVNIGEIEKNTHDILYLSSKIENQTSLELTEMLREKGLKIIFDNTSEVEYQTLLWYIKGLLQAKNIIIHLIGQDKINNYYKNAEPSLFAGLGCGLGRKVLLIAPSPFRAPIDYDDILIEYESAEECVIKIDEWIDVNIIKEIKERVIIGDEEAEEEKKLNLLKLGIGCEIAEDEKDDLLNYFIEIDAYNKAPNRKISIFAGRKGTGKSAIYIKLEHELEKDDRNYNIVLKPDSNELLQNVDMAKLFNNTSSKKDFYFKIWSFIFYSKLFLSILNKVKSKGFSYHDERKIESRIIEFNESIKEYLGLNFFGAIKKISEITGGKSLVENPEILGDFDRKILKPLKMMVKEYLKNKKYFYVNILADNLDKTWEAKYQLKTQSEMILTLLEFSEKIVNQLVSEDIEEYKVNKIIFVRKDIFDYILTEAREPDKLTTQSYEIDWTKHPNLLRRLVEKRFEYCLNLDTKEEIDEVWKSYFDFNNGKHPFETIRDIIATRPRDIIYFMSKLFESAVDNDHAKANRDDLYYAIEAYTNFLHQNTIAEMKAEFPRISEILKTLQESYGQEIEYKRFIDFLSEYFEDINKIDNFLESLFRKGYLLAMNVTKREKITDLETLKIRLKERFFVFRRYKIVLIPFPEDYLIKRKFFNYKTLVL